MRAPGQPRNTDFFLKPAFNFFTLFGIVREKGQKKYRSISSVLFVTDFRGFAGDAYLSLLQMLHGI